MRLSLAIAWRTLSTSAPNRSHTLAISFMNEMRVASIAFAAYLQSSALAVSITMIGAPVRVNGRYNSRMRSAARESLAPITTRSGFRKSSTAAPCFRNSGLLTTLHSTRVSLRMVSCTSSDVPDRHRALVHDDLVAVHRARDVARGRQHVLQVGRAVLAHRGARPRGTRLRISSPRRAGRSRTSGASCRGCAGRAPRGPGS